MNMLERTVRELKGEETSDVKTKINLKVDIRIPEAYLPQVNLRLNLYKRVSSADSLQELKQIEEETADRFGPLPASVRQLFRYGAIKYLAGRLKIESIDRVGHKILMKIFPDTKADPGRFVEILNNYSGSITPDGVMTFSSHGGDSARLMDETITILKELLVY
jgi:transcription-repair coupling factor (superfamily II helicase)